MLSWEKYIQMATRYKTQAQNPSRENTAQRSTSHRLNASNPDSRPIWSRLLLACDRNCTTCIFLFPSYIILMFIMFFHFFSLMTLRVQKGGFIISINLRQQPRLITDAAFVQHLNTDFLSVLYSTSKQFVG